MTQQGLRLHRFCSESMSRSLTQYGRSFMWETQTLVAARNSRSAGYLLQWQMRGVPTHSSLLWHQGMCGPSYQNIGDRLPRPIMEKALMQTTLSMTYRPASFAYYGRGRTCEQPCRNFGRLRISFAALTSGSANAVAYESTVSPQPYWQPASTEAVACPCTVNLLLV